MWAGLVGLQTGWDLGRKPGELWLVGTSQPAREPRSEKGARETRPSPDSPERGDCRLCVITLGKWTRRWLQPGIPLSPSSLVMSQIPLSCTPSLKKRRWTDHLNIFLLYVYFWSNSLMTIKFTKTLTRMTMHCGNVPLPLLQLFFSASSLPSLSYC